MSLYSQADRRLFLNTILYLELEKFVGLVCTISVHIVFKQIDIASYNIFTQK